MGTELVGDRLSRGINQLGTNCGGPNVRGPYAFGTKCVIAVCGVVCKRHVTSKESSFHAIAESPTLHSYRAEICSTLMPNHPDW